MNPYLFSCKKNFGILHYVLFFVLFIGLQQCTEENNTREIPISEFKKYLISHDVEKLEVVNLKRVFVYIKAESIGKPEFKNIIQSGNTGPHYSFPIGSVDKFEEYLEEAQKDFQDAETIYPHFIKRPDILGEILASIIPFLILILPLILWLPVIIKILKSEFKNPLDKLVWVIVTTFIPLIGLILFWTIGKHQIIKN